MLRAFFIPINFLLVLGLVFSLSSCNNESPHTQKAHKAPKIGNSLTDARGKRFDFTHTPARILPLSQTQAAWLYELGAEDRIVGRPEGLEEPPGLIYKPALRLSPLDTTSLLKLRPDCILMRNAQMDSFSDILALGKQHGIPVFVQNYDRLFNYTQKVHQLGVLVDNRPLADSLAKRYKRYFNTIQERTAKGLRHNVVMVLQFDPLVVVARDHHLTDLIEIAGGQNPFAYDRLPYKVISTDSLLVRNPEFVFLPRSGDGEAMNNFMKADPRFQHLQAIKSRRVFGYDPRTYLVPGPNLVLALQEMASIMHTEADASLLYMDLFGKPIKTNEASQKPQNTRLY